MRTKTPSLGLQSKQARLTHLAWHLGTSPPASMYPGASACVVPWGHSKLPSVASVCNPQCSDLLSLPILNSNIYVWGRDRCPGCQGFKLMKPWARSPARHKPGSVVHTGSPNTREWRQEDWKLKVILGYMIRSRQAWSTAVLSQKKDQNLTKISLHLGRCVALWAWTVHRLGTLALRAP